MNLLADIFPTAGPGLIASIVIGLWAVINFVNTTMDIVMKFRAGSADTMPTVQLNEKFSQIAKMVTDLEKDLNAVRQERREVSDKLFGEIRSLTSSVNSSMNDVARAIGRLEGSHELAQSIKEIFQGVAGGKR